MNLVSSMVGLSIMGAMSPVMMDMSIAPIIASKRAQNLGLAESAAVTYAALHEGASELTDPRNGCVLNRTNFPAIEITCTEGKDTKYVQSVSRSFRLNTQSATPVAPVSPAPGRTFDYPYPTLGFTTIYCHTWEDWGINTSAFNRDTNTWVGKSCRPFETTAQSRYALSDVEAWRYDIHKINGFGPHSDY